MYLGLNNLDHTNIIMMKDDVWGSIGTDDLESGLRSNLMTGMEPITSIKMTRVAASNVTTSTLESTSFISYAHVKLKDQTVIINCYDNMCTQEIRYNVLIFFTKDIDDFNDTMPYTMDVYTRYTATLLYSKFRQTSATDNSYLDTHNLLDDIPAR